MAQTDVDTQHPSRSLCFQLPVMAPESEMPGRLYHPALVYLAFFLSIYPRAPDDAGPPGPDICSRGFND